MVHWDEPSESRDAAEAPRGQKDRKKGIQSVSEHRAHIQWTKATESFLYEDYNRDHTWDFPKSSMVIEASAAPKYKGSPQRVDPEEALVASISSCHMLTFLAICSRRGIIVERYDDDAIGWLEPNEQRRLAITRVILKPNVTFASGHRPDIATLAEIHEESHEKCFIANSVKTAITVDASAAEVAR
jgi:organic hydroperoxide reductase OsmC/OhrA